MAKAEGHEGYSGLKKAELVALLSGDTAADTDDTPAEKKADGDGWVDGDDDDDEWDDWD